MARIINNCNGCSGFVVDHEDDKTLKCYCYNIYHGISGKLLKEFPQKNLCLSKTEAVVSIPLWCRRETPESYHRKSISESVSKTGEMATQDYIFRSNGIMQESGQRHRLGITGDMPVDLPMSGTLIIEKKEGGICELEYSDRTDHYFILTKYSDKWYLGRDLKLINGMIHVPISTPYEYFLGDGEIDSPEIPVVGENRSIRLSKEDLQEWDRITSTDSDNKEVLVFINGKFHVATDLRKVGEQMTSCRACSEDINPMMCRYWDYSEANTCMFMKFSKYCDCRPIEEKRG